MKIKETLFNMQTYEELINIKVSFIYYSSEGIPLFVEQEDVKPLGLMITKNKVDTWYNRDKKVEDAHKEYLNNKAQKYLDKYQRHHGDIQIEKGIVKKGKHIVKVEWTIVCEFDFLEYDKYLFWKEDIDKGKRWLTFDKKWVVKK